MTAADDHDREPNFVSGQEPMEASAQTGTGTDHAKTGKNQKQENNEEEKQKDEQEEKQQDEQEEKQQEENEEDPSWRGKASRLMKRVLRYLPFFSLGTGLLGALLMDRSSGAAVLVIGAAAGGWLAVLGFGALQRIDSDRLQGKKAMLFKVGELSTLIVMQTLMQQCLFFALPFYALSASLVKGHISFLLILFATAAVTLWDPLFERAIKIAGVRFGMQFLAAFVSFNAMLPALGLSNTWSLFFSVGAAALGIPLQGWVFRETSRRELIIATVLAVVVLPLFLVLGGGASIPPAPLQLSKGEMGTSYDTKAHQVSDPRDEVVGRPPRLVCGTDIRAPRGLGEDLFHVWQHPNGQVTDRIKLRINGGRKAGFRTYSQKGKLGQNPWGVWTCSVVTNVGQLVGRRSIEVLKPES